ncbi:MAG: DNA cytosine methyltransferase [Oscillospiraceae bacterium]|nr:DNA cytosine methyltransferase [Oscillospiraceae bacterium]
MDRRPTCMDLFCGAGGMSLGFEQAGFDIIAGVEIDPVHANVHSFNFPNCYVYRQDISDLSGKTILEQHGKIDVVIGGPPCQGFSLIGKRNSHDERNQLIMEYMRIVSEIKPSYFVMENVSGLTVGYGKQYLEEALNYIESHGYLVVKPYLVLNAEDYGVPQSRKRLFLLGYRSDLTAPEYPKAHEKKISVEEAISDLPDIDLYECLNDSDTVSFQVIPEFEYAKKLHNPNEDECDFSIPRLWDNTKLTGSLRTNHTPVSRKRFHDTPWGETEKISHFRKLDPKGQCNTLRAGTDKSRGAYTSPRPINPYYDRVISVREAQRLHSFPDWFRMHITKWHGFREVGNAVPPYLARAVAEQIIKAMGVTPVKTDKAIALGNERLLTLSVGQSMTEEQHGRE